MQWITSRLRTHSRSAIGVATTLAALGSLATGTVAADATEAGTPEQAAKSLAERFAARIISDYRHTPSKQRRLFKGEHGVEVLVVYDKAKDSVDKNARKPGEYVLQVALSKHVSGKPSAERDINSVTIDEFVPTSSGVMGNDVYSFEVAPIDNRHHWDFMLTINDFGKVYHYSYTTAQPEPKESIFPLTMTAFRPIAIQAQAVLTNAGRHVPISMPSIPFPPPTF